MIHEDIVKDIAKAETAEAQSAAEFAKFQKESEAQIQELQAQIVADTGLKEQKEKSKEETIGERAAEKGSLMAEIEKIKKVAASGCDYVAINYAMRAKNRHTEMDSLTKARAILLGGEFTAPDPNREIKPGYAAAAFL